MSQPWVPRSVASEFSEEDLDYFRARIAAAIVLEVQRNVLEGSISRNTARRLLNAFNSTLQETFGDSRNAS